MKQRFLLILSLMLTAVMVQAGQVSKEEAKSKAEQFKAARHANIRGNANANSVKMVFDGSAFFVFNIGNSDGFVIVSGDDRTPAILAYSDAGSFDPQNIPENMKAFLQGYADEMKFFPKTATARAEAQKRVVKQTIAPLLKTTWGQDRPYNNLCPMFLKTTSRCVTGCVATAMVQLMYYHKWPETISTDIDAYDCKTSWSGFGKIHVDGVAAGSAINWGDMWTGYPYRGSSVEESSLDAAEQTADLAVAQLMAYCGRSVTMEYRNNANGGSTASLYNASKALVQYFDYDPALQYVNREDYTTKDWENLIYTELKEKRPVMYSGQSTGGGHTFMVDGYEGGYFHVNWGWGGAYDCHVLLSEMNPYSNSGIGASSTDDGYSYDQSAVINAHKNIGEIVAPSPIVMSTGNDLTATATSVTRGTDGNFTVEVDMKTWNWSGSANTFDIGYGVYDANGKTPLYVKSCVEGATHGVNSGYPSLPGELSFGKDWADGIYYIVGVSRVTGVKEWSKNKYSNSRYLTAVIEGDQMTILSTNVDITVTDLTIEGNKEANSVQHVKATIQNNSSIFGDYLYLLVDDELKGGKYFEVDALKTKVFDITFVPTTAGTFTVKLAYDTKGTDVLTSGVVTITAPGEGTTYEGVYADVDLSSLTNVDLSTYTVDTDKNIFVKAFSKSSAFKVRFVNNSESSVDGVFVAIWKYNEFTGKYQSYTWGTSAYNLSPKSESYWISYGEIMKQLGKYEVRLYKNAKMEDANLIDNHFHIELAKGYVKLTETGAKEIVDEAGSEATIGDDALSVEIDGSLYTDVHPNSNPNTVYVITGGSIPPSLAEKNVVDPYLTSAKITLFDGSGFGSTANFTTTEISYTRSISTGTDGTGNGWTTIVLPFDVDEVTVDGVKKDWFHNSADTGKDFWVKKFVDDGTGKVYFDYADKIEANTPYIIAIPGDKWGAAWDLTGKTFEFKGSTAYIRGNANPILIADEYQFVGTTKAQTLSDVYILNAAGNTFEKTSGTVEPFRAYFESLILNSASSLMIDAYDEEVTEIQTLPSDIQTPVVYTLDGRRVTGNQKKGIYIVNGKKVIK